MRQDLLCGSFFALLVCLIGCSDPGGQLPDAAESAGEAEPVEPAAEADSTATTTTSVESTQSEQPPAGDAIEITFDDINLQLQPDVAFRPWMLTERAQELDGQLVRIAGYMLPDAKLEGIDQFVLLRNTECKFGPGGQPDHLLSVTLRKDELISYRAKPIQVSGTLKIDPYQDSDGYTWYIYELNEAGDVATLRR